MDLEFKERTERVGLIFKEKLFVLELGVKLTDQELQGLKAHIDLQDLTLRKTFFVVIPISKETYYGSMNFVPTGKFALWVKRLINVIELEGGWIEAALLNLLLRKSNLIKNPANVLKNYINHDNFLQQRFHQ